MSKVKIKPKTIELDAAKTESSDNREALLDDLDPKHKSLLLLWMNKYIEKKQTIDELNADLESIKLDRIEPLRLKLGLDKIDSDEWFIARRPGKKALDKDKLKIYLVNKGVPVKIVTTAFEIATSTGKPFTEIKRKKEKE